MSIAPEDVLFFIADHDSTLLDTLYTVYEHPSRATEAHFRRVNSHLVNDTILTGQMVIITPEDPMQCTIWEQEMAAAAREVDAERERLTDKERQLLAKHYAIIGNAASYSGTMYGWTSTYFDQKKRHVERILKRIEELYRTTYDKTGSLKGEQFFAQRRSLLLQVDTTINGMLERKLFGQDIHANRIKSQLGLSSKSIVHQWNALGGSGEIKNFSSNYRHLTNTARTFGRVGHLAIALDVGSSVAAIAEACSLEPDSEFCARTKYEQAGRAIGSIGIGSVGGKIGAYGVCNLVFGLESFGTSLLWCTIVSGVAGGYVGSSAGSVVGEKLGSTLYSKRHVLK
ncbi:hypothetical protein [Halioxenophilus aromaticivorans]|uniref:LysM domain-containing protein n=1 Tax=Halioxenophilus aromaticivorans TaxID=1306992 RepID=A0AAV3TZN0_9ALTE